MPPGFQSHLLDFCSFGVDFRLTEVLSLNLFTGKGGLYLCKLYLDSQSKVMASGGSLCTFPFRCILGTPCIQEVGTIVQVCHGNDP